MCAVISFLFKIVSGYTASHGKTKGKGDIYKRIQYNFFAIPISYFKSSLGHGGGYSSEYNKGEKGGKSNYVDNIRLDLIHNYIFQKIQFCILYNDDGIVYLQN